MAILYFEKALLLLYFENHLIRSLQEYPMHISDRVTTFRLHLDHDNYLNVISIYAPTLDNPGDIKDKFYEELTRCLLILGDFNAMVGWDYEAWPKVLGRHLGCIVTAGRCLVYVLILI